MIPDFGLGEVLPPFMGGDAVGQNFPRSPYLATMSQVVTRFATSPTRVSILRGFLNFRSSLAAAGFESGYQWLDGSFVEACEVVKGRAPDDIDVVSLLSRPRDHIEDARWLHFVEQHGDTLLDSSHCKQAYQCDAYFIDLGIDPELIAEQAAYWFGLFSHQRGTFRWKGLVQTNLRCDDEVARRLLNEVEARW